MTYSHIHNMTAHYDKREDQISILRNILVNYWGLVGYSDYDKSYDPELRFFEHEDYAIYAMQIWLYLVQKRPDKKKFLQTLTHNLKIFKKSYDTNRPGLSLRCTHVAKLLWNACRNFDLSVFDKYDVRDTEIELQRNYRTHCCDELSCTDNASRRYFFRSRVVYIREINTYVLTNLRKYKYLETNDEYVMDQTIYYEILDYCPFCGCNLKELRIEHMNSDELIKDAILKWRDCGIELMDDNEEKEHFLSYYGVNIYDSERFISEILSKKYANFDNEYGVDVTGKLTSKNPFITVEKLFELCENHDLYSYFDYELEGIDGHEFPEYCRKKFQKREPFTEDEKLNLTWFVGEMIIAMCHNPEYFDELLGEQK